MNGVVHAAGSTENSNLDILENEASFCEQAASQHILFDCGEYAVDSSILKGLASCKVAKTPDQEGNNLSELIATTMKKVARAAPQTNRETLLDANSTVNDEDRYCRIPFLDILDLIISFSKNKKRTRNSPMLESPEYEGGMEETFLGSDQPTVYFDAFESFSQESANISATPEVVVEADPSSEGIPDAGTLSIVNHEDKNVPIYGSAEIASKTAGIVEKISSINIAECRKSAACGLPNSPIQQPQKYLDGGHNNVRSFSAFDQPKEAHKKGETLGKRNVEEKEYVKLSLQREEQFGKSTRDAGERDNLRWSTYSDRHETRSGKSAGDMEERYNEKWSKYYDRLENRSGKSTGGAEDRGEVKLSTYSDIQDARSGRTEELSGKRMNTDEGQIYASSSSSSFRENEWFGRKSEERERLNYMRSSSDRLEKTHTKHEDASRKKIGSDEDQKCWKFSSVRKEEQSEKNSVERDYARVSYSNRFEKQSANKEALNRAMIVPDERKDNKKASSLYNLKESSKKGAGEERDCLRLSSFPKRQERRSEKTEELFGPRIAIDERKDYTKSSLLYPRKEEPDITRLFLDQAVKRYGKKYEPPGKRTGADKRHNYAKTSLPQVLKDLPWVTAGERERQDYAKSCSSSDRQESDVKRAEENRGSNYAIPRPEYQEWSEHITAEDGQDCMISSSTSDQADKRSGKKFDTKGGRDYVKSSSSSNIREVAFWKRVEGYQARSSSSSDQPVKTTTSKVGSDHMKSPLDGGSACSRTPVTSTLNDLNSRDFKAQGKDYLTVPQPSFDPRQGAVSKSPDSFKRSPAMVRGRSPEIYQGSSGSEGKSSKPCHSRNRRACSEDRRYVISPATHAIGRTYQDAVSDSAMTPGEDKVTHFDLRSYILSRVPYQYGRMLLAWFRGGVNVGNIRNLLYGCPKASGGMQNKRVSIVAWGEDTYLPPGTVLKFSSTAEATRAHREVALKYGEFALTLPMEELMRALVRLEAAQPPLSPSTLVIRSKKKQDCTPDTQELESCLDKYGEVGIVRYLKKEAGTELVCEVEYDCVTHGFLALVALDDSYLRSLGGLHVKFKRCGMNEVLVPRIADVVRKRLKRGLGIQDGRVR